MHQCKKFFPILSFQSIQYLQTGLHVLMLLRFAFQCIAYKYQMLPFRLSLTPRVFNNCVEPGLTPMRALSLCVGIFGWFLHMCSQQRGNRKRHPAAIEPHEQFGFVPPTQSAHGVTGTLRVAFEPLGCAKWKWIACIACTTYTSCLQFSLDLGKEILCLYPAFVPKVSEFYSYPTLELLVLLIYLGKPKGFRRSNQLFVSWVHSYRE